MPRLCILILGALAGAATAHAQIELRNRTPEIFPTSSSGHYKVSLEIDAKTPIQSAAVFSGAREGRGWRLVKEGTEDLWSARIPISPEGTTYHFRVKHGSSFPLQVKRLPEADRVFRASVEDPNVEKRGVAAGLPALNTLSLRADGGANGRVHLVFLRGSPGQEHAYYRTAPMSTSDFGTEVDLGPAASAFAFGALNLAVSSPNVFVLISNWPSGGSPEISVVASADDGATFSQPVKVSESPNAQRQGRLVWDGSRLHVAWLEGLPTALQFRVSSSADGGHTFGPATTLSVNPSGHPPALAISGGNLYVAYCENDGVSLVRRLPASGTTLDPPQRLTSDGAVSQCGTERLAAQGPYVHAAWHEWTVTGAEEHFLALATRVDSAFGPPSKLTVYSRVIDEMALATDGKDAYVAWIGNNNHTVIFARREGTAFHRTMPLSPVNPPNERDWPTSLRLALDQGHVHVAWQQGTSYIRQRHSGDGGYNWAPLRYVNESPAVGLAQFPDLQARGADRYIVWLRMQQQTGISYVAWRLRP